MTARWPEFAGLAASVNAEAVVLDSELVVFDDEGRPRFDLVQNSGVGSARQAVLQLFDVLSVDGTDTIELPYEDRRRLLDQLVEPGDNWLVSAYSVGNGEELLEATRERGLEGRDGEAARLDVPARAPARRTGARSRTANGSS